MNICRTPGNYLSRLLEDKADRRQVFNRKPREQQAIPAAQINQQIAIRIGRGVLDRIIGTAQCFALLGAYNITHDIPHH